jgi:hypothetical protein
MDDCKFRRLCLEGHCIVVILAHSSVTLMKGSSLSYHAQIKARLFLWVNIYAQAVCIGNICTVHSQGYHRPCVHVVVCILE